MTNYLESALHSLRAGDYPALAAHGVLTEALSNRDRISAWRHPLGFIHVELTDVVDAHPDERLRLHIWDNADGVRDDFGTLHDHVWNLRSAVLVGALRDDLFLAEPDPDGPYRGARVRYGASNSAAESSRFRLTSVGSREICAPGGYEIPAGVIHMSTVDVVPTVTLVLGTDDPVRMVGGPLVLSAGPQSEPTSERPKVDPIELEIALQRLIANQTH